MFKSSLLTCLGAGVLIIASSSQLLAAPPKNKDMPTITIYPQRQGSLTVPNVTAQRDAVNQTAGSVGFVDSEEYKTRYSNSLNDILKDKPGVYTQTRYGQEQRVSVRGSGAARGFHGRGIEILQDGIPNNLADGSVDFYQVDPLSLRSVEIYKGGNGLSYGASTLGGAINFVTPTARTAIAPNILRLEGGSFDTVRGNAQVSRIINDVDMLANVTVTRADGFRDHQRTETESYNGNIGYSFSPDVETRFYLGIFNVDQKIPGTVTRNQALSNPTTASATALSGDQARDTRTQRVANRTSIKLGTGKLDMDTWAIHKNLYHPIFQVIDQDGWTYGVGPRYNNTFYFGDYRNDLLVGGRFFGGNNEALQFTNVAGSRGNQTLNARQDAYNFNGYFENRFWFMPKTAFMTGAKVFHEERHYEDLGNLPANPTPKKDSVSYQGINPKIGFLFQPEPEVDFFINATRSQDVPDFTDLTQTTATTTRFVPLETQDAWTLEAGTRGKEGRFTWDVTAYRSWVKNELMQFTTGPGIPASTFNAGNTIHQGIEMGASAEAWRNILSETSGDNVTLRQLWNYSDFRFQDDRQYGNNRIAGVPQHVLRSEVSYKHRSGFYFTPIMDWVPDGVFADQANTVKTPDYALFGLQTGIQLENGVLFYVDARNLGDKKYISDVSTVNNARTASQSIYHPGEGRSVFVGVRYAFE